MSQVEITLFIVEHSMGNTLTQWTGATITLFENDHAPNIHGNSIALYPGSENKIAVNLVNLTKLQ